MVSVRYWCEETRGYHVMRVDADEADATVKFLQSIGRRVVYVREVI